MHKFDMIKNLNIIKKLKSFLLTSAMTQDRIDIYRAAAALKFYQLYRNGTYTFGIPSPDQITLLYKEIDDMTPNTLNNYVHTKIHDQITNMFRTLELNEKNHNTRRKATHQTINESDLDEEKNFDKLTYELIVKNSTIENANDGLFLSILDNDSGQNSRINRGIENSSNGSVSDDNSCSRNKIGDIHDSQFIIPGTVIGLYPGHVYLKTHLLQSPQCLTSLLPDEDFMLMTRYDECIIDGRTVANGDSNGHGSLPTHPYALCHKINHCGQSRPNVMQVFAAYLDFVLLLNYRHMMRYMMYQYDLSAISSLLIKITESLKCHCYHHLTYSYHSSPLIFLAIPLSTLDFQ